MGEVRFEVGQRLAGVRGLVEEAYETLCEHTRCGQNIHFLEGERRTYMFWQDAVEGRRELFSVGDF